MTNIQKLSTQQKLGQLAETMADYFAIVLDSSRSLKAAFNAVHIEKYRDNLFELIEGLAADLGVTIPPNKDNVLRLDSLITNIADAAEKKGLDAKSLQAVLPDYRVMCDAIRAQKLFPSVGAKEAELDAVEMKTLAVARKVLSGKSSGGPKQ